MKLSTDSPALTGLLAALVALISLSVDTTLPAMPQLEADFAATAREVQLTLTAFLLGVAFGQLFCGPLSDRFGRRPVFLVALAVFTGTCVGCALADSIASLTAWRFVMGFFAVAGPVLSRAVVRDLHAGSAAARLMSRMMVAFSVSPIVTPLVGGYLVGAAGWRSIYVFMAAIGVTLFVIVAASLPETAPKERQSLSPAQILRNFATLLRHRGYVAPMLVGCASQCGIYAFVTNSSFVAANVLGFTPWQYAGLFSFVMVGHIVGAQLGARLVVRRGIRRMLGLGAGLGLIGGVAMSVLAFLGVQDFHAIAWPMLIYLAGAGLVLPSAQAAAMTPFPKIAGAASSLQLMIQLLLGASLGMLISASFDGTTRPMAYAIGACSLALYGFERLAKRLRALETPRG